MSFDDPTTFVFNVPHGTDVSKLAPAIILAPGETVSPESGVSQDFSAGPVRYVVTKPDGTQLCYRVMGF